MSKKTLWSQPWRRVHCPHCEKQFGPGKVLSRYDGKVMRCWVGHAVRVLKEKKC